VARPYWKGYLKLSLVSCPIALFPATSEREKISFHQLNKETGNRIRYRKVDAETGDEVPQDNIIKGYEVTSSTCAIPITSAATARLGARRARKSGSSRQYDQAAASTLNWLSPSSRVASVIALSGVSTGVSGASANIHLARRTSHSGRAPVVADLAGDAAR
jgi:hypothetical protein